MPETTLIAGTDTSGRLTRADLALVPAPHSTATHQVIPHIDIVQALEEQLGFRHIAIASEEYAVTKDGKNFFGVMTLDQGIDGAQFALGVRNSHSKQFRLSIVVGVRLWGAHHNLTPTTAARRMLRSWLLRTPIENRQPGMPVSRSSTPNIFIPSLLTAYSSVTTPM